MDIEKYALNEGDPVYETLDEAREAAQPGDRIVAHVWKWADSELVETVPADELEEPSAS